MLGMCCLSVGCPPTVSAAVAGDYLLASERAAGLLLPDKPDAGPRTAPDASQLANRGYANQAYYSCVSDGDSYRTDDIHGERRAQESIHPPGSVDGGLFAAIGYQFTRRSGECMPSGDG